jgi:hypothetical protein
MYFYYCSNLIFDSDLNPNPNPNPDPNSNPNTNRLLSLFKKLDPTGLFFLSGDVHMGEISRVNVIRKNEREDSDRAGHDKNLFNKSDASNPDLNPNPNPKSSPNSSPNSNPNSSSNSNLNTYTDNWMEFTSSGLTHTCGDSFFNKMLCPLMIKTFSGHRLQDAHNPNPNPGSTSDPNSSNLTPNSTRNPTPIPNNDSSNSKSNPNSNSHPNAFIEKNFGIISDITSSSSLSGHHDTQNNGDSEEVKFKPNSSSNPNSNPNSNRNSNPNPNPTYMLNISIISVDTGLSVMSQIVRSTPNPLLKNKDGNNRDINKDECAVCDRIKKNDILYIEVLDFPVIIPKLSNLLKSFIQSNLNPTPNPNYWTEIYVTISFFFLFFLSIYFINCYFSVNIRDIFC